MELGLCFGNKSCIEKREAQKAANQQALLLQQQALQQALSKSSGGLSAGAIAGIIFGIIAITIVTIIIIKKSKNK